MPALLVFVFSISHLQIFISAIYWSLWVILFPCPHILMAISFCLIFPAMGLLAVLPLASLFRTLLNWTRRDREAVAQHMWLSPHPYLFPHLPFFFFFLPLLTSSSLVILSQWTSGTDGKRRSWTLVPLSRLTHLGHRSTSALTSHPSALTKSRLRWLPAAVNFSGSHGVCLWAKCPLESKPGCLYGGRHLFLETMSKYKSAQDTPTTLIRNKFMNKMCAESHVYWNIYLTQNLIEIIYFRFPFISFLHLIKVLNQTQPSPDFCLLFVFRRQCIFLDKLQLNYNLKGWHLAEILLVHVILSNSMHSFASKHKMWNTSEENYSAHACITKSCW